MKCEPFVQITEGVTHFLKNSNFITNRDTRRPHLEFQGVTNCHGFRTVHLCAELLLPSDLSPVGVLTEVRNRRLPKVYTPTQTTETAHTHTCAKWPSMAALN